eukprot:1185777-Prorocentrum_minimum.AAC.2
MVLVLTVVLLVSKFSTHYRRPSTPAPLHPPLSQGTTPVLVATSSRVSVLGDCAVMCAIIVVAVGTYLCGLDLYATANSLHFPTVPTPERAIATAKT